MITLTHGIQQQFRYRQEDINIIGRTDAAQPLRSSRYSLNGACEIHFYVEPSFCPAGKRLPYGAKTPSILRLAGRPGYFNIEISVRDPALRPGLNKLEIEILGSDGVSHKEVLQFEWNPEPVPLPMDLTDLRDKSCIQSVGQVVNGDFEVVPERNVIRSRLPVAPDSLLVLGSLQGSQEAVFDVEFKNVRRGNGVFLGLSDFFSGHWEQSPELGIKPGYSTAGLITISPRGIARTWIAVGDLLFEKDWNWVVKLRYPARFSLKSNVTYTVRHQVLMESGVNLVRFRIWKKGTSEPNKWLCQDNNAHLDPGLPRIEKASFGLFQYGGGVTEWSQIRVRRIEVPHAELDLSRNHNVLQGSLINARERCRASWISCRKRVARLHKQLWSGANMILRFCRSWRSSFSEAGAEPTHGRHPR